MLYYLLTTIYVLTCLVLLLVILLQQGKGGDMASAFGGGTSQAAFGARAGATLLSKLTTGFAVLTRDGETRRIPLWVAELAGPDNPRAKALAMVLV